jgi:hypothetical protein
MGRRRAKRLGQGIALSDDAPVPERTIGGLADAARELRLAAATERWKGLVGTVTVPPHLDRPLADGADEILLSLVHPAL